jgi:tetratricopeptide (TPR) repeat protein
VALALVLLVAAAYWGAPQNGFHFDDLANIVLHRPLHPQAASLAEFARATREALLPTRPLANLTLAIDWWRGGGEARVFQITNVALHAAAALAVFGLLLALLRRAAAARRDGGDAGSAIPLAAGLGAALWALHPIQVQAVTYVVQRMTVLAALFVVLALLCYLRGRFTAGPARVAWLGLSGLCVLLGVWSKENALIAPVLLLAAELSVVRGLRPLPAGRLDGLLIGVPVLIVLWLVLDLAAFHGPVWEWAQHQVQGRSFTLAERLRSQPGVIAFHLSQIAWPLPDRFSVEHEWPLNLPWHAPQVAGGFALLATWLAAGVWFVFRPRHRVLGFLLLWAPITLAIESSFVPLEIIFEHRMYLPSIGLAGLAALGFAAACSAPARHSALAAGIAAVATAVVLGLLLLATRERVSHWRDGASLYEQAVKHAPNSARVWNQLGLGYEARGRARDALRAYDRAIELDPRLPPGHHWVNRGNVRQALGDVEGAFEDYAQALRYNPALALAYNNRGLLRLRLRQYEMALADFDRAVELAPQNGQPWSNRGTLHYQAGRDEDARRDLQQAIELEPRDAVAQHYLGRLAQRRGDAAAARAHFAAACRLGVQADCGLAQ